MHEHQTREFNIQQTHTTQMRHCQILYRKLSSCAAYTELQHCIETYFALEGNYIQINASHPHLFLCLHIQHIKYS